jgi:hypothetical protein
MAARFPTMRELFFQVEVPMIDDKIKIGCPYCAK